MSALGEYYSAMANAAYANANSTAISAQGQANLANAHAGMVAPMGQSQIAQQAAQTGLTDATAAQVAPLAKATIAKDQGSANYTNALATATPLTTAATVGLQGSEGRHYDALTSGAARSSQFIPLSIGQTTGGMPDPNLQGHATGTSRIKAPGDGTVDTTKANLANGEAVLNKGAADHLGQPAIQALNAVGMLRMGMVPGQGTQDDRVKGADAAQTAGKPGSYAKGVSKAGPKAKGKDKPDAKGTDAAKPSDTPSLDQIDPKMLAAAMQMGAMGQQAQAPQQQQMPPIGPGGMM